MLILITGDPGVGKTTALIRLADMLKSKGYKVGGIVSRDIRVNNTRVGFEFIDIATNNKALLASIDIDGPRIGKYHVSLKGCKFAADVLLDAINNYDIIICDELAPMEFKSHEFKEAARALLDSSKDRIVSIHKRLKDDLILDYKSKADLLLSVTFANRDSIASMLFDKLINKH